MDELESLVSTLLDYARMEDNRPTLDFEPVKLNTFVPQLLAQNETPIDIEFLSDMPEHAEISADAKFLNMLVLNLLNNACQHTLSEVQVSVKKTISVLLWWKTMDLAFHSKNAPRCSNLL